MSSEMSVEDRVEGFILAPSDPAWGDERNRDEYYRAATIGQFWCTYAFVLVAIIAALQGAAAASLAAMILPGVITLAMFRYCRRRGVAYAQLTAAFSKGRRKLIVLATVVPLIVVWLGAMAVGADYFDTDPSSLFGAVVGAAFGIGVVIGAAAWVKHREKRQDARAAEDDDVFE
ncbi:hypothetical protein [Tsukamurella sp. 1534]|uniref:hypothetical protein n=1 Tax=Tsukamurella sp. 1534 TaxID=1151061 RepID=UPI0002F622F4|nr:hypothetical protein [Tsukamurella sp. 1534]